MRILDENSRVEGEMIYIAIFNHRVINGCFKSRRAMHFSQYSLDKLLLGSQGKQSSEMVQENVRLVAPRG